MAFNGTSGWTDTAGAPLDMTKNTRIRNSALSPDKRYDTYLIMQLQAGSTGNLTPGRYVATLPNGQYDVTVGVGDPTATNSVDEIVAQPGTADATTIIDHFVPTSTHQWSTVTKRVNVSGGQLVLDPTGGTQTKLDFVDAVPAAADVTPPTVTTSLAGTLVSGTTYNGAVTVTASASDTVGVTGITYTVDGGAATPYTAPFKVSTTGDHTVVVSATDAAANVGTSTQTFTIASLLPTSVHVNFQPAGTAPAGYTADTGVAFDGTKGWTDASGNPLDMTANSRIRNSASSPGQAVRHVDRHAGPQRPAHPRPLDHSAQQRSVRRDRRRRRRDRHQLGARGDRSARHGQRGSDHRPLHARPPLRCSTPSPSGSPSPTAP